MKNVKVLGPGCKRCDAAVQMVKDAASKAGVEVTVEKVTDYAEIAGYGIMRTPGLVVDEQVLVSGRVPKAAEIAQLLSSK